MSEKIKEIDLWDRLLDNFKECSIVDEQGFKTVYTVYDEPIKHMMIVVYNTHGDEFARRCTTYDDAFKFMVVGILRWKNPIVDGQEYSIEIKGEPEKYSRRNIVI